MKNKYKWTYKGTFQDGCKAEFSGTVVAEDAGKAVEYIEAVLRQAYPKVSEIRDGKLTVTQTPKRKAR